MSRLQESKSQCWTGGLVQKTVNQEFKLLRQLVLIEQFKNYIHERDIDNLQDAATTAGNTQLDHSGK